MFSRELQIIYDKGLEHDILKLMACTAYYHVAKAALAEVQGGYVIEFA